jgi:hypothetical protein
MSDNGNVLFLVCKPCQEAGESDFGVKIAGRTQRGYYGALVPPNQLNNWFSQHSKCAGRTHPDHFNLGYLQPQNADQSELEAAVHLAVVQ